MRKIVKKSILALIVMSILAIPILAQVDTVTVKPGTETVNITEDTIADQTDIPEPTGTSVVPTETVVSENVSQTEVSETPQITETSQPVKKSPGFEPITAFVALVLVVYILKRR